MKHKEYKHEARNDHGGAVRAQSAQTHGKVHRVMGFLDSSIEVTGDVVSGAAKILHTTAEKTNDIVGQIAGGVNEVLRMTGTVIGEGVNATFGSIRNLIQRSRGNRNP